MLVELSAASAADYPVIHMNGDALDSSYDYTMHFEKADLPASKNGVWSISAYRENIYQPNPINRYGPLPAMAEYNPDGSVDVYLHSRCQRLVSRANERSFVVVAATRVPTARSSAASDSCRPESTQPLFKTVP